MRELLAFFLLAYGISWAVWLPLMLGRDFPSTLLWIGTMGPTVAALIVHRIFNQGWKAVRLWSSPWSLLIGTVLGGGCRSRGGIDGSVLHDQVGI